MPGQMFDSETVSAIPKDAKVVAGYVDGQWPNYDEMVAAFPDALHVSITVSGRAGAMVGDCEKGDMTPSSVVAWAKREIEAGRRPTLYYSKDSAGDVAAALGDAEVAVSEVDFWVADWTRAAHLLPGTVATQWCSPGTGSGGNYDISETADAWPAEDEKPGPIHEPEPAPAPSPKPPAPGPAPTGEFMPPTLKQGALEPAVRSLQSLLNLHAAGLTVDGSFGPATETAVKNFQKVMGLGVDGIVGPKTWTALCTFG
jgi:hypothetical protein